MSPATGPASASGPPALLDAALRRDPARPLLTFYDDATGERAELSVATFATWVAKTANLLRDDLGFGPGRTVSVELPVHWQAAVWFQAAWALGASVVPSGQADVAVISYDGPAPGSADDVVALGLGPLGLPRADGAPPPGTSLDYDREIAAHGDRFVPTAQPDPAAPALVLDGRAHSGADLVELTRRAAPLPAGARLLLTEPLRDLPSLLGGLLVPLGTEVTAVLVRHLDPSRLAARVAEEGIIATVTEGVVPSAAGRVEATDTEGADPAPALPVWEPQRSGQGPPIP
jgi:uncharacterized protein (TIGR03089 family)